MRFLWPTAPPCLVPLEWQLCHWWQSRNLAELFKGGFVSPTHLNHQEYHVSDHRFLQNSTIAYFSSGLDPWALPQPAVCPIQELLLSELLFHAESTSSSPSASIFPDNISWRAFTCSLQVSSSKLSQHVSVLLCISVGRDSSHFVRWIPLLSFSGIRAFCVCKNNMPSETQLLCNVLTYRIGVTPPCPKPFP